jgi:hypothetical protein
VYCLNKEFVSFVSLSLALIFGPIGTKDPRDRSRLEVRYLASGDLIGNQVTERDVRSSLSDSFGNNSNISS